MERREEWYDAEDVGRQQLIVGNGINIAFQSGKSWEDLLRGIASDIGVVWEDGDKYMPFPLLYERFLEEGRLKEEDLKKLVREYINGLEPEPLDKFFEGLQCDHIITTNYDRATTESVTKYKNTQNDAPIRETTFSLFRRSDGERTCWQIHGYQGYKGSITLGYDRYSRYLSEIKKYILDGVSYENYDIRSLKGRVMDRNLEKVRSWIDFLFLEEPSRIYIIGLSMDFVEIHLWWILTQKARIGAKKEGKELADITYIYRKDNERDNERDFSHKIRLLESKGVETRGISSPDGSWEQFYVAASNEVGRI